MADLDPFDRQELEILLTLVRVRRTYVLEHTQAPEPVREQLLGLENKLVAQLGAPAKAWIVDFRAAIARDIQLGHTSQEIRDEIIAKVGMMAAARTVEMQARYDAAVERERALKHQDKTSVGITIAGPQSRTTPIARAILELLQEAGIPCAMPEEESNPTDGDSIEALGYLMRENGRNQALDGTLPLRVIVQTVQTSRAG